MQSQLLLRKTGDATPLLHAMRIGQSHRDIAILLLGAFSRWINHLDDSEIKLSKTRVILKALSASHFPLLYPTSRKARNEFEARH